MKHMKPYKMIRTWFLESHAGKVRLIQGMRELAAVMNFVQDKTTRHRPLPPGSMGVQQWQFSCFAGWRFGMEKILPIWIAKTHSFPANMWTHENFKPLRSVAYLPISMYKYIYIYNHNHIYMYTSHRCLFYIYSLFFTHRSYRWSWWDTIPSKRGRPLMCLAHFSWDLLRPQCRKAL